MSTAALTPTEGREFLLTVPWGHIAAKSWNASSGVPILLVHGLMDNAGSWDRLAPLLPKGHYVVAVDLPGHGRSSHFPSGLSLKFFDFVTAILKIVDQLNWQQFIFIGHTFGGLLGFYFAAIFPNRVLRLLSIDAGLNLYLPSDVGPMLDTLSSFKKPAKAKPVYPFDHALDLISASRQSLSREAAEALAKRCLVECQSGYVFSMDERLKVLWNPGMNLDQWAEMMKRIKCPVWVIAGSESQAEWVGFRIIERTLKKAVSEYKFVVVPGDHNATLDHPGKVGKVIADFISRKSPL